MTGFGKDILYRASTGFERALVDVDSARITDIPAELIRDIWDPWNCPIRFLPYLAWAMGVQYWNDRWSETTKRNWVANHWLFKSRRGTKAGADMAVDYSGRDISPWGHQITKVFRQPMKVFSGPSLTKAERETWLQNLPQVRVWLFHESGYASICKSFYGSSYSLRLRSSRFCLSGSTTSAYTTAPIPSTAITRLQRRARWVEQGVEQDISVEDFGSYFRLRKHSVEDSSVFCNRTFGLKRYFIPSTAYKRLITIQPKSAMAWRTSVTPTLDAVQSEPERVTVSGMRRHSVFCDVPLSGGFFAPTTAPYRIYQRYAVLDPTIRELRRTPVQFMGTGRYGFPSFTAWLEVSIGNKLSNLAAGYGFWSRKYYIPHDGSQLAEVRLAMQAAKRLRDKILLRSVPTSKFVAGDYPILADITKILAS